MGTTLHKAPSELIQTLGRRLHNFPWIHRPEIIVPDGRNKTNRFDVSKESNLSTLPPFSVAPLNGFVNQTEAVMNINKSKYNSATRRRHLAAAPADERALQFLAI